MDIETKTYRAPDGTLYRVRIVPDEDASSPRDGDNATVMHTFDGGYYSPEDITRKSAHDSIFPREYDSGDWYIDLRRARKYAALDPNILAVRGLDRGHDGTLRLSDDDATAGYIAITRQSWDMCIGGEFTREQGEEVMRQEVDAYNTWASGEYVGYIVEQQQTWVKVGSGAVLGGEETMTTWEEVDSLWGIDDQEYALKEAVSTLPEDAEED